jgi:hypothetical protein
MPIHSQIDSPQESACVDSNARTGYSSPVFSARARKSLPREPIRGLCKSPPVAAAPVPTAAVQDAEGGGDADEDEEDNLWAPFLMGPLQPGAPPPFASAVGQSPGQSPGPGRPRFLAARGAGTAEEAALEVGGEELDREMACMVYTREWPRPLSALPVGMISLSLYLSILYAGGVSSTN